MNLAWGNWLKLFLFIKIKHQGKFILLYYLEYKTK
jgi:hypothetical protein